MKTIVSWSTGKDAAWALHVLRQTPGIEVVGLLTTINEAFDRVSMHGVRRTLVEAQARATGLPLHAVSIPFPCPNDVYEERMAAFIRAARDSAIAAIAFGDLFLPDVRAYREANMRETGIQPLFPLWNQDTRQLARDMIAGGLKARVVCVDTRQVTRDLIGQDFDEAFLSALPSEVDPCGENGEFHTFAYAGPMFQHSIEIATGPIVERDRFVFADLTSRTDTRPCDTKRGGPAALQMPRA